MKTKKNLYFFWTKLKQVEWHNKKLILIKFGISFNLFKPKKLKNTPKFYKLSFRE